MSNELKRASYVSLATFRRSGVAVPTAVWCAELDGDFFVFSASDAGKVKRIRNDGRAQMAVCDARGKILGEWYGAQAELFTDPDTVAVALKALRAKYGFQMWLLDLGSRITGRYNRRAYIRVRLNQD